MGTRGRTKEEEEMDRGGGKEALNKEERQGEGGAEEQQNQCDTKLTLSQNKL